jgi:hypothetical protein
MSFPVWARATTAIRRSSARRPWIQWAVIAALAVAVAASVHTRLAAVDAARRAWDQPVELWVADAGAEIGDPVRASRAAVPAALAPRGAVREPPDGLIARQRIGIGEIVTELDVMAADDGRALAPDGWLVVPVEQQPASGAGTGERVVVVSDGYVLSEDAVVVGAAERATLVAVPADVAPLVPAAAEQGAVTLLRVP